MPKTDKKYEWHGWYRKADQTIGVHIGMLPGHKRPSLYLMQANEYYMQAVPLATFHSVQHAKEAADFIDKLLEGVMEKG